MERGDQGPPFSNVLNSIEMQAFITPLFGVIGLVLAAIIFLISKSKAPAAEKPRKSLKKFIMVPWSL